MAAQGTASGADVISVRGDGAVTAVSSFTVGGVVTASAGVTVTAGGLSVTAGGLTVKAGGLSVIAGGLVVQAGGISVSRCTPLNMCSCVGFRGSNLTNDHTFAR
jgi:hypothetical protein